MDSLKFKNKQKQIIIIIYFFVSFFTGLFLFNKNNYLKLGTQDWDQHYAYAEANIISLLKYHQLPLWNPYHCGGMTQIGNPQNDFLSPFFLVILFFGPIVGYKMLFLIYLFLGLLGSYYLGILFEISKLGSFFISFIYSFSVITVGFALGTTNFLGLLFLPFLCYFYVKSLFEHRIRDIIFSAFILALIFFGGFHYFLLIILFLFTLSFLEEYKQSLPIFLFVILLFLLLTAIKLIPALEILNKYPITIQNEINSGYSLKSLYMSLFSRQQTVSAFSNWGNSEARNIFNGLSFGFDENSMYVSIFSLILFILGLFNRKNKNTPLLIIFLFFLFMSFGYNINPSLYGTLHSLPILNTMRVAQRFRFFFIIPYIIFVGFGVDLVINKLSKVFKNKIIVKALIVLFLFLIIIDVIRINLTFLKNAFINSQVEFKKTNNFIQRCGTVNPSNLSYNSFSDEYLFTKAGFGSPICYEPIHFNSAIKCPKDEDYKGEYYLINSNKQIKITHWSPNIMIFDIDIKAKDELIINQNYDKDWKIEKNNSKSEIINHDGYIGVSLFPGKYRIKIYYLPNSFIEGSLISYLTLLLSLICLYLNRDKKIFCQKK